MNTYSNAEINRIKNYLYRYCIEENEENLKKVFYEKKIAWFMKKFLNWLMHVK